MTERYQVHPHPYGHGGYAVLDTFQKSPMRPNGKIVYTHETHQEVQSLADVLNAMEPTHRSTR